MNVSRWMLTPGTQKRVVSGTPWWFTVAFLGFCAVGGVGFVVASVISGEILWMPLLTVAGMAGGFVLMTSSMPTVRMDDRFLYISRFGKRAAVPLEQVADVREVQISWPFRPYSVTLDFSADTPFGRSLYLGAAGSIPGMTFPSAVKELRLALKVRRQDNRI